MTTHVNLANQLCFSVYNVNRLFNKFYQDALAAYGLTYPQYLLLTVLWNHDHRELRELGSELETQLQHPDTVGQAPRRTRLGATNPSSRR
jgi:hypothetical protein